MKPDHIDFQERSVALAFLITFRCYGTWLHGDDRGSVDRRFYNRFGSAKIIPSDDMAARKAKLMKQDAFVLGVKERSVVEQAIREVCIFRGYQLIALNIRTNHVHLVVSNSGKPERLMDSFKAYATKALRQAGLVNATGKVWSRHGSTRYLWTEDHVAKAAEYVVSGQGGKLPEFD